MTTKLVRTLLALAVLSFGTAILAHAGPTNLVTNGSFETGDFTGWTPVGDTSFNGVCSDGSCPISGGWNAEDGVYSAYFGPVGDLGGISQIINTTPGDQYTVSFWLALPQAGTPNFFQAEFGNAVLTINNWGGSFGWQEFTLSTMATSSQTNLEFLFRDDPSYWFLDNVSVTQGSSTPEPGTLVMFGTGLLGLAGIARRKFRL